ncbi:MAG: PD-(D/E)XK nuclease-like domain-containing protein [Allorhizobium sp.]
MSGAIISAMGAYEGIDAKDYHGNPHLLPGPSLSASGAKTIIERSPAHFWHESCLNPNREESDADHFAVGRAAHDLLLLGGDWETRYHVLPEGFAWNKTVAMAEQIAAASHAKKKGKTLIKAADMELVKRIADRISSSADARNALLRGKAEVTLAWQDELTGVWLRARPDFMPLTVIERAPIRAVPDLKIMAPTHCSPRGFSKAVDNFGYHYAAAHYGEGMKRVYGVYPTHWFHVVIEREEPHTVSLYELPAEDIDRGRLLMRQAINVFDQCLKRNDWPGYADRPMEVGLPIYARMRVDEATETDLVKAVWGELEDQAA